jgi:hypothetical protein
VKKFCLEIILRSHTKFKIHIWFIHYTRDSEFQYQNLVLRRQDGISSVQEDQGTSKTSYCRYVGGHDDENFCPNKEQFPQHNQIMELKAGSEKKLNPMAKQAIGH